MRNKVKYFIILTVLILIFVNVAPTSLFADSSSDVESFVTRFYKECLSRDPDSAGLNVWVDWLEAGAKTGADVAYRFVFSDEFIQRNVSNSEYLTILYRAFFGREPDSGGYSSWLGYLNTGESRLWVLAGFINSQEFKNLCTAYGINPGSLDVDSDNSQVAAFVARFYQECLSRDPDSAGLNTWVDWLEAGAKTGADVAYGFVFSDEFIQRNVSNSEYLTILYRAFFGREPDSGGYNIWLGYLNTGKSRLWVLAGFINSQEFKNLCASYEINPGSMPFTRNYIPIVALHGIEPSPQGSYEISTGAFEFLLSTLKNNGYQIITFMDLLNYLDYGKALPEKPVIITSDDGYQSIYTYAFPILKKYGYKMTVFLSTGYIGNSNDTRRTNDFDSLVADVPTRSMLIWPEVKTMSGYGCEFLSHGCSHANFGDISLENAKRELSQSKSDIEIQLGKSCLFIAWPHDSFNSQVIASLPALEFRGAVRYGGGIEDVRSINIYQIKRIPIYAETPPGSYGELMELE